MKKIVRNVISAISIIAIVLASFPQNEVVIASDIAGTEIETGAEQLETTVENQTKDPQVVSSEEEILAPEFKVETAENAINNQEDEPIITYTSPNATVYNIYESTLEELDTKTFTHKGIEYTGYALSDIFLSIGVDDDFAECTYIFHSTEGEIIFQESDFYRLGLYNDNGSWKSVLDLGGYNWQRMSGIYDITGLNHAYDAETHLCTNQYNSGKTGTTACGVEEPEKTEEPIITYTSPNATVYNIYESTLEELDTKTFTCGGEFIGYALSDFFEAYKVLHILHDDDFAECTYTFHSTEGEIVFQASDLDSLGLCNDSGSWGIVLDGGSWQRMNGIYDITGANHTYDVETHLCTNLYNSGLSTTTVCGAGSGISWENGETDYIEYVYARPGETATLTLPQIINNDGVRYNINSWSYDKFNVGNITIENSAGKTSITTLPVNDKTTYHASASDRAGNTINATFYVRIGSGLHWENGDSKYFSQDVFVNSGETTILKLPEFVIPADEHYTIEWSYSPPSIGTMEPDIVVESAADQVTCTTIEIFEYTSYQAVVTDDYGNSIYASFNVNVETGEGSGLKWYDGTEMTSVDCYVASGESATLTLPEITINMGEGYTVSWYHQGEGTIEGAAGSVFVTPAIYGYEQYEATVTDNYGYSIYVVFYVRVSSSLVWENGTSEYRQVLYVNSGDSLELNLPQICMEGGESYTVTWQWWELDGMMSEGHEIGEAAGQESYTTFPITGPVEFGVTVRDNYNNFIYAYFDVYLGSGLAWVDWDDSWSTEHTVQPNASVYLAVPEYNINEGFTPTIQWEQEINDEYEIIEGADSNTYMTPSMIHDTHFRATVSDNHGTVLYYNVFVYVDSGLEWTGSNYININVEYGGNQSLTQPPFSIADGLTASYTWYKNDVLIEEENIPVLYLENITESATYKCEISDGYNTITSYFNVRVNTGLKFSNGATYYNETIYVLPGEPLVIPVPAYTIDFGTATSQWHKVYGMDPGEAIAGEADGSLIIDDLQRFDRFVCVITDSCGNEIQAYYLVIIDSGLEWEDGSKSISTTEYVNLGDSYDVSIPLFKYDGDIDSEITYEWYLYNPSTFNEELLEDFTGNTLHIDNVRKRVNGHVCVNDKYGNSIFLYFYVKVDTGFHWIDGSEYGTVYVEVPYGGTFDIWIPEFTINDGVDYTIRVSGPGADGYFIGREVTKDEIVTSGPITKQCIYNITIDDEYNNGISFSIYCRNSYSLAWADGLLYSIQNINLDDLSDTVTLQLPEYVYDGGKELSITWSGADGTISEDSKSYTVAGISKPTTVYAKVTDNRYSTIIASFNIGSASTLAFTDGSSQMLRHIVAEAGEPLTLELPEFNNDSPVLYKWSRASKDTAAGFKKSSIGTEDTLQISHAEFSSYYYICEISDMTGHTIRAIYDILAPSHDFNNQGVCTLCGEYEAQALYVSITLDGRIGMNYYIDADDAEVYEGAYGVFSHGEESEIVLLSDALKGSLGSKSVYKLTYYVDAKEINDQVSLSLFDARGRQIVMHNASNEEIDTYGFSVAQYLDRVGDSGIEEFNNLISGMSAYGNLAAKYFGKIDEFSPNEVIASELSNITAETIEEYASEEIGTIPEGITYYGSSLVLDSDTSIYHYFKLDSGASIDEYQFFVDGVAVTPVVSGNLYKVEIRNISAAELNKTYETIVALVGNTFGYTINYSALSYVYDAINYYDPVQYADLLNTVKALYLYNNSASAYFNKRTADNTDLYDIRR